jgi:hypothetical protein
MSKAQMANDGTLLWWCLGCDGAHGVPVRGDRKWEWNGSLGNATLTPSVLVNRDRANPNAHICHCFVREGKIEFLADCTHHLAGQTVDMGEFD